MGYKFNIKILIYRNVAIATKKGEQKEKERLGNWHGHGVETI